MNIPKGEVLEYVGIGLGMKLHVESDGYFWDLFGFRIPLPGLITPGKTFLCHRNNSAKQFDIGIGIRHALFGATFTQAGVFREVTA